MSTWADYKSKLNVLRQKERKLAPVYRSYTHRKSGWWKCKIAMDGVTMTSQRRPKKDEAEQHAAYLMLNEYTSGRLGRFADSSERSSFNTASPPPKSSPQKQWRVSSDEPASKRPWELSFARTSSVDDEKSFFSSNSPSYEHDRPTRPPVRHPYPIPIGQKPLSTPAVAWPPLISRPSTSIYEHKRIPLPGGVYDAAIFTMLQECADANGYIVIQGLRTQTQSVQTARDNVVMFSLNTTSAESYMIQGDDSSFFAVVNLHVADVNYNFIVRAIRTMASSFSIPELGR